MPKKLHAARQPGLLPAFALLLSLAGCEEAAQGDCSDPSPGFFLTNVDVIDGSGSPAIAADVRIVAGLIAAVGSASACAGDAVIDGAGLTLAPGFIDTHSHADGDIDTVPDALAAVSQGITTVIVGQDGGSHIPLADFFARMEARPSTVNFASFVGHNSLRERVLGEDSKRVATRDEIATMADFLKRELAAGALGLSTGLEYEPGIYSETAEVVALAQIAADAGGRYISHMRSEDRWLEDSIDEIIAIGRETRMPVQI